MNSVLKKFDENELTKKPFKFIHDITIWTAAFQSSTAIYIFHSVRVFTKGLLDLSCVILRV